MKRLLFFCTCLVLFLTACEDRDIPNMNGMWQLKTIEQADRTTIAIDTIYYSFQRQAIFSYTRLTTDNWGHESTYVLYGYVDYPSEDKMHILIDSRFDHPSYHDMLLWKGQEVEYNIISLSSKELILGYNDEKYYFTKF